MKLVPEGWPFLSWHSSQEMIPQDRTWGWTGEKVPCLWAKDRREGPLPQGQGLPHAEPLATPTALVTAVTVAMASPGLGSDPATLQCPGWP